MPKANSLNTIGPALSATGRRSLFASALALAFTLASPVLAATDGNLDAELIRLCDAFQHAHKMTHAANSYDDADDDNGTWSVWLKKRDRVSDLIDPTPAVTPAGQRAKAQVALALLEEGGSDHEACDIARMVHSVLMDVAGRAG